MYINIGIIECGIISPPKYGEVHLTGTTVGSIATYSCFYGYELIGLPTQKCQDNGYWSGIPPQCVLKYDDYKYY